MSLKTRLILLPSLWIVLIVAFFNVFVYTVFQKKTMQSETRLLWNKAQIILRNPDIHLSVNWSNQELLNEFKADDLLIRIIDAKGNVRNQMFTNEMLLDQPAVYRGDYYTQVEKRAGIRMLFIQVPLYEKDKHVAQLEIGTVLNVLSDYLSMLATALTLTTAGIILFSAVGGFLYKRFMFRPIDELVQTMQAIQIKGSFSKISPVWTRKTDELGRLAGAFNAMIDRLQENDNRQRQFTQDASHELKTPLTVIESYARMLKRWGGEDPKVRHEAFDVILGETERMKKLVHSLLKLAESENGAKLDKQSISLMPLINETAETLSLSLKREITVKAPDEDISLNADMEQIRQLLVILLDNAVKYSKDPVAVVVRNWPQAVEICVSDRGIGIPQEELGRVFERFYRVDKARNRATGGSGLGLSIANRIASLHGGTIRAESKENVGTSFIVTLPKQGN